MIPVAFFASATPQPLFVGNIPVAGTAGTAGYGEVLLKLTTDSATTSGPFCGSGALLWHVFSSPGSNPADKYEFDRNGILAKCTTGTNWTSILVQIGGI